VSPAWIALATYCQILAALGSLELCSTSVIATPCPKGSIQQNDFRVGLIEAMKMEAKQPWSVDWELATGTCFILNVNQSVKVQGSMASRLHFVLPICSYSVRNS